MKEYYCKVNEAPKSDITILCFEEMAKLTNDPFIYIMATHNLGFHGIYSDKVRIVKAWNKYHKDKQLPLPKPPHQNHSRIQVE